MSTAERVAPQRLLDEEPELAFRRYAVAFHVAARWCGEDKPPLRRETRFERAMESYEDDMLLYAHRDEAPFFTRVVPTEIGAATVHFPPELEYEAEGRRKRLRCFGATEAGRTRKFRGCDADLSVRGGAFNHAHEDEARAELRAQSARDARRPLCRLRAVDTADDRANHQILLRFA
jgi:hypothetical protein